MKNKSVKLSTASRVTARGYEIKRMPVGAFLQALESIRDLPGDLMSACFPGMDAGGILSQLSSFDADMLLGMLVNAMAVAPKHVIKLIAQLTGVPEDKLLEDEQIGLDGLMEIVQQWVEINGLLNFTLAVRDLIKKTKAAIVNSQPQKTGFKGLLRKD